MPVYHVEVYACLNFVIKGKNYDLACICIAFEKGVCKTCFRLYVQQLNQGFNLIRFGFTLKQYGRLKQLYSK